MSYLESRYNDLKIKLLEKEVEIGILKLITSLERKRVAKIYLRNLTERLEKLF